MDVHTAIPLRNYTTMRLGGPARFMVEIHTPAEAQEIAHKAHDQNVPWFVLGGGSNVVARDDGFSGIVIRNRIMGFQVAGETDGRTIIKVGAGELWDDVVKRTVDMNLTGIEAMSAIPGTAGAAPVQNIGAYGQEIADTLLSLEAYDSQTDRFITLLAAECNFSYRSSIFRESAAGRYIITSITLGLYSTSPMPPFYAAVQRYFDEHSITIYTPQAIRDAVMNIRFVKLPDPAERPNTGSFFKNAIIEQWQFDELQKQFEGVVIPTYKMPGGTIKIPTGWLIEQAGFKGKLLHGIRVHDKNCLVLINESATGYADLAAARDEIIGAVRDQFRIAITQEPLEI
ncbi:MAG TPA: UDP-N-acetylmuramate dehydrogenase [Candidatus Saccharimonadaceae bacterium]|nr:UDP-N-acetylmuramate dehydrogenase [Candidatus Saccharimonadaceae bacterium]